MLTNTITYLGEKLVRDRRKCAMLTNVASEVGS